MFKKLLIIGGIAAVASGVFFSLNEKAEANSTTKTDDMIKVIQSEPSKLKPSFLKGKLEGKLGLTITKIEETPVPGIALIISTQGLFYSSYDGDYFIQGKLYSIKSKVTDLAEQSLSKIRLKGLEKFKDDMIVFKAKNEKYVVSVFTDITCGYCRKMHKEMDGYNNLGITFRYLAYPRSGIKDQAGNDSSGYKKLRSVWCADNPKEAMTNAKNNRDVDYKTCDNTIEEQFSFGRQVGVNGTPAIILSNGMMVPGYQPPEQLEQLLKSL